MEKEKGKVAMNKVILMGGSHHNGLGLVRSFGVNGIAPYGIIIGEKAEKSYIRASKYWAKTWAVKTEEDAIKLLLKEFANEQDKPVIIPWSDRMEEVIDQNLDHLKEKFIVPSLDGQQGAVAELMDKQEQVEFARKYDLPMAKSVVVDLNNIILPDDMVYPCIVKPVVSAEGKKLDIRKCGTKEETLSYLAQLRKKDYQRFLVQEYINCAYEFEFCGSINKDVWAYTISKDTRIWPTVGGTNSFFECISDEKVEEVCVQLLKALEKEHYSGCFDIEMFYTAEKVYLNEINWRNTGNSFFALGTNVHYAVAWYYSVIGKNIPSNIDLTCTDKSQCAMNEATDLRHMVYGNLSFKIWNADRKRTQSFALWYEPDLKPTLIQYWYLASEMIRRKMKCIHQ